MQQIQHLLSLHFFQLRNWLSFDLFAQNRRGSLADRTTLAVKVSLGHAIIGVDLQLKFHHITAQGILILVATGGMVQLPLMVGGFEMLQNVFLVDIFRHARSSSRHVDETQFSMTGHLEVFRGGPVALNSMTKTIIDSLDCQNSF